MIRFQTLTDQSLSQSLSRQAQRGRTERRGSREGLLLLLWPVGESHPVRAEGLPVVRPPLPLGPLTFRKGRQSWSATSGPLGEFEAKDAALRFGLELRECDSRRPFYLRFEISNGVHRVSPLELEIHRRRTDRNPFRLLDEHDRAIVSELRPATTEHA